MSKVFIFIDGSNFYHKLKELTKDVDEPVSLLDFDYTEFFSWLIKPDDLQEARYYIGALKRKRNDIKSEKVYADQQRLVAKLQQHKVVITFGQMIQHPDKSIHEKGVDVRLAVEMIRFARENKYDTAYLLSSDTDLVPAVEEVKSFNKKVTYIGIVKGQSFGLTKASDDTRLLRFEDIEPFFELAPVSPSDVVYDLGSGDGRLLFAALERGAGKAVGVELDPECVRAARETAKSRDIEDSAIFMEADVMEVSLADASVVLCYLSAAAVAALKPKLESELKRGTRVVMKAFPVPGWKPVRWLEYAEFYLYIMPPESTE